MKLLLLSLGGFGDFIETVPSIRALRESRPQDTLSLVVAERVFPYAARCPYVDNVYACPIIKSGTTDGLAVVRIAGLLLRLRLGRFDLLLNFMDIGSLEGSRRMERFVRFIRPAISGGRNRAGLGRFFDRQVLEKENDGKSDGEYFYEVASLADRPLPSLQSPDLWVSEEECRAAERLIADFRTKGPLILIHPGSDRQTRRWLPQRFAEVAAQLCRRRNANVAVIGASGDWPAALEIEKLARPYAVRALPGLKSVGILIALVKKADLVICNNSMAMHIAAAAQTPCAAVCASGDISRDRSLWNRESLQLLWKPLSCSPCYFSRCPRPRNEYMECMERISVDEVLGVAERLLARRKIA